ncbi:carbohydrate-binding protein [Catenuloplanes sp. NPDC051500]|uniref:carbohydrate-binding protein n=1 Tax=Catenuloplanes sp. NPDC051500 TaxID=3363959 RepID=UPI0037B3202D
MPLVTPRTRPAAEHPPQQQAEEQATQALPTVPPREAARTVVPAPRVAGDDTVILPAFRGQTTTQSREHPPTNLHRQDPPKPREEPGAAPAVPPDDGEKPSRRGPSRTMIGVGIAVVLVLAAAWLLVSLPNTPGSADWAGESGRNWPPDAPGGTTSAELTPSAPPPSAPFVSPAPGQVAGNGLLPGVPPSPARAGSAAVPPVAGTTGATGAPGAGVPSSTPTGASPTTSPLLGGDTGSGQIEAEAFAWQWGVASAALDGASGGQAVSGIANGDWLRFDNVNLGTGAAKTLKVRIANGSGTSGRIEVRYDTPWTSPAATVSVDNTGGWSQWRTRSVSCSTAAGPRTVYVSFVSRGSGDFVYLDWISFS